ATLREARMPLVGAIVNRVNQPLPPGEDAAGVGGREPILPPDLASRLAACLSDHAVLAARDARNIERLRQAFDGEPILCVPDFSDDIHDVEGLLAIHRELFDD
ncbi:MAG: hypothetical protein KGL15_12630, partial [Acidobacteriota bacterium]|nr:hypothetical protein [Acidobacteriota bacterium]